MLKIFSTTKKKVFTGSTALLLAAALTPLYLTGCVQGNSEALESDMNFMKTTNEKARYPGQGA